MQNKHDYFVKLLPSKELDEGWIEDLNKTLSELEIRADLMKYGSTMQDLAAKGQMGTFMMKTSVF